MFVLSVFLSLDVFWCFVLFDLVLFCLFLQCFDTGSLDKKDNTGVNTVLNTGVNTRVNTGVNT